MTRLEAGAPGIYDDAHPKGWEQITEVFLKETMDALATDADEVMVARAKFLRGQAGPSEASFVASFNEQLQQG